MDRADPSREQKRGMTGWRTRDAHLSVGSYTLRMKGVSRFDLGDPYHLAVALSWPQFFALLLLLYLAVNLAFATVYWLIPGSVTNARPGSFADDLFFSIETLATVGYGELYPTPPFGRVVATVEIVCGLAFTAILTGLTFVRFSRPRAKMIFAPAAVVASHKGRPTLMVRLGNGRASVLTDASAKLSVLCSPPAADGRVMHRAQELKLERSHVPIFPLYWTIMHVLDESSPLSGYDADLAARTNLQLFVTFEARDATLATEVHEIHNYETRDIRFGVRYRDIVTVAKDGSAFADLKRLGELEPEGEDSTEPGWTEQEGG